MKGFADSVSWYNVGQTIAGIITSLIGLIVSWMGIRLHMMVKRLKKGKSDFTLPLDVTHKKDMEITIVLDRALREFNAMRAYLAKFHNGERFTDGSEIIKKSRTNERVRRGIAYQAERFQNMLVASVPEEMKLVLEEGPGWRIVDDLGESKFKWLMETGGVTAVARVAVRCGGGLVGFLGLDFDCAPSELDATKEQIARLIDYAQEISLILSDFSDPNVRYEESNRFRVMLCARDNCENRVPLRFTADKAQVALC